MSNIDWAEVEIRLSRRVTVRGECWEFPLYKGMKYGLISIKHKMVLAHRVAWRLHTGKWPKKLILHRCDNPPCIRPSHLFEGTHKGNTQDAVVKGRMAKGERSGTSKLKEAEVLRIIRMLEEYTHSAIAKYFKVSKGIISKINCGKNWSHLRKEGRLSDYDEEVKENLRK